MLGGGPYRSKDHLRWVRSLPCCLTGSWPVEAAHVRLHSGMATKPGDHHALPLRPEIHRVEHRMGGGFWERVAGMSREDARAAAEVLWALRHDEPAARLHLEAIRRQAPAAIIAQVLIAEGV